MDEKIEAWRQLTQASATLLNPAIKRWKEQGKRVVGLFCSYIPEEIIYAAGLLPFRMRAVGSVETTLGDTYLGAYARKILEVLLKQQVNRHIELCRRLL